MYRVKVDILYNHDDTCSHYCYHCMTLEIAQKVFERELFEQIRNIEKHMDEETEEKIIINRSLPIDELYEVVRKILRDKLYISFRATIKEMKFED